MTFMVVLRIVLMLKESGVLISIIMVIACEAMYANLMSLSVQIMKKN